MKHANRRTFLAAIDLDGTLFGPSGSVSDANLAALAQLVQRGFHLTLASGRHPRNMAEIATALPSVDWLVSCQGGEASDRSRTRIFRQEFMPDSTARELIEAGQAEGFGALVYTGVGERTPVDGPEIQRYRQISKTEVVPMQLDHLAAEHVFKVMWVAEASHIDAFLANGGRHKHQRPNTESLRSHACVFEHVPLGVSKATGVSVIAAELGIPSARVAAFGDAENDLALFRWAGFSVAMPQADAEVRGAASMVAPTGPQESAFARGVGVLLEKLGNDSAS